MGVSFDGASVMMGENNGTAKKLKDMVTTPLVVMHAVAHVQQLANSDAFMSVEYYEASGDNAVRPRCPLECCVPPCSPW